MKPRIHTPEPPPRRRSSEPATAASLIESPVTKRRRGWVSFVVVAGLLGIAGWHFYPVLQPPAPATKKYLPKNTYYDPATVQSKLHPNTQFRVHGRLGEVPVALFDIKQDLILFSLTEPSKLDELRTALIRGEVDGSTYEHDLGGLMGSDAPGSLREQWFLSIAKGDKPETSLIAKITLEWIDEAIALRDRIRRK